MSAGVGFVVFLSLTLVLLALAVFTGFRALRVWHISSVVSAFAALGGAIFYALELGQLYDLASAGWITPVHLFLAKFTTASFLLPVITGLRTIWVPNTRKLHRKLAYLALALTVVTAITGTIMLMLAQPQYQACGCG